MNIEVENILLETIQEVLKDVHIEVGNVHLHDFVCYALERAISNKIIKHEIDYYTEIQKENKK